MCCMFPVTSKQGFAQTWSVPNPLPMFPPSPHLLIETIPRWAQFLVQVTEALCHQGLLDHSTLAPGLHKRASKCVRSPPGSPPGEDGVLDGGMNEAGLLELREATGSLVKSSQLVANAADPLP